MIPVTDDVIRKYDLSRNPNDKKSVLQRKIICNKERSWCQIPENTELILKRANIVYDIVTNNQEKNRRLVRRCCDFTKLEAVLERYIKRLFKNPVYIAISDREKVGDILDKNGIVYIPMKTEKPTDQRCSISTAEVSLQAARIWAIRFPQMKQLL